MYAVWRVDLRIAVFAVLDFMVCNDVVSPIMQERVCERFSQSQRIFLVGYNHLIGEKKFRIMIGRFELQCKKWMSFRSLVFFTFFHLLHATIYTSKGKERAKSP